MKHDTYSRPKRSDLYSYARVNSLKTIPFTATLPECKFEGRFLKCGSLKGTVGASFHASERTVYKEFQNPTSSAKEEDGIGENSYFFSGEERLKVAHK